MPIIRRNAPSKQNIMFSTHWTHHYVGRQFSAGFRVSKANNRVEDAEPQIHWMIGQRLDKVTETVNARGDEIRKHIKA